MNQFGPKNGINKGCDETCGFFHPNACRNSVKDRTCSYSACRFFHLKDTKLTNKQLTTKQNTYSQKPKPYKKQENYKPKFSKKPNIPKILNNTETKNKFQVLENANEDDSEDEEISKIQKPVFQKADPAMAVTLQEIMKKLEVMDKWQKNHQIQTCNQSNANLQNSSQQNWRQSPVRELVSMTQEQKARWDSKDRNLSQSMET